jgi:hypothetical protein
MRLIGIHIDQKNIHPFIRKSLKDEWYPFFRGIVYPIQKKNVMDCLYETMDGLYQVRSTSKVKVSISCIVGKMVLVSLLCWISCMPSSIILRSLIYERL